MDRDETILNYLQNRLTSQDREQFEQAMTQDASLAAEVDVMKAVRADLANGPKHQNADAVWARLSGNIDATLQPANENRRPWAQFMQYAAVAIIAVATWQLTVVPRISSAPDGFRAASERAAVHVLQVKFAQNATIGEIATLLVPLGGTIVDGPGAVGVVRVSFPDRESTLEAMQVLSARSDLVELVLEQ